MRTKKTAGKAKEKSAGVSPETEASYWREQHSKSPWGKKHSYEQFESAYRFGYNSFLKHDGKSFEEIEPSLALDYAHARPEEPLPWDTVRPAVNSIWERMSGVISPRDPGRGVRSWI